MHGIALFAAGPFRAFEMQAAEVPELQRLYEANPDYFRIVTGEDPAPDAAARDFEDVPGGDWTFTRKWMLALRGRDDALVGFADIIADLGAPSVWHVGLFMVDRELHGSGVPHALYAHMEAWMRKNGARWSRLGVVRGNARGERFWEKMGYLDVSVRSNYRLGNQVNTLRVMMKPLAGGTVEQYRALMARDAAPGTPAAADA